MSDKIELDSDDLMATAMTLSKQVGELTFDVTAAKLKLMRMGAELALVRKQLADANAALELSGVNVAPG
jgi:uncharacterized phage protein gp47/JayE